MFLGLAAAILVAATPGIARAQGSSTSSITGVVVDAEGGFVPGAAIKIKSDTTSTEFNAVSGANGVFTVPAVNVGIYTITVTLQGFKQAVLKGVTVTAGQPRPSGPRSGWRTDREVVVSGATEIIQTTSAAAATVINTKRITSLPVGSRSAELHPVPPGVQTASSVRNSTVNGLPQARSRSR